MPRSSKAQLTDETISELENQFFNFIDSLSSENRKKFFFEFLTSEEKMMMYKRLALYWCLLEGYSLAKIQQMIGVTHDTTRVYNKKKNFLSPEFKALVQQIAKNESMEDGMQAKQVESPTQPDATETHEDHEQDSQSDIHEVPENIQEPNMDSDDHQQVTENDASMPDSADKAEWEKKTEPQKFDENLSEVKNEDASNNIWAVEHTTEEERVIMKESEIEKEKASEREREDSGMMPSENKDSESSNPDEGEGKKKSGIAKFFGF